MIGQDSGSSGHILVFVVVVLVVGLIFHRVVAPMFRFTLHIAEQLVDLSVKIGITLLVIGGVAAALLVVYAMQAFGGSS